MALGASPHGFRLGFAVQLYLLRYPGRAWLPGEQLPSEMLRFIARQIGAEPTALADTSWNSFRHLGGKRSIV
jgi:TnpA family transposase